MSGLMNITVGKLLESVAKKYPDRKAFIFPYHNYETTWKELDEEATRVAKGFLKMGIGKGDHVAIWANNIPEWVLTLFATSKIGAVLVTVNTNYKIFELEYLLAVGYKCLVMTDGFKE